MPGNSRNQGRAEEQGGVEPLLTARELAAILRVDIDWVYDHSAALGAFRLGAGPRARLRFDLAVTRAALTSLATPSPAHALKSRTTRARAKPSTAGTILWVRPR